MTPEPQPAALRVGDVDRLLAGSTGTGSVKVSYRRRGLFRKNTRR